MEVPPVAGPPYPTKYDDAQVKLRLAAAEVEGLKQNLTYAEDMLLKV